MPQNLYIDLPMSVYAPGEVISGRALWALNANPGAMRLTLGWWTEGKGTKDARIESSHKWQPAGPAGEEPFKLTLPPSPYSFSGTLITLKWALELSVEGSKETAVEEIIVSPFGKPIELPTLKEA